MWIISGEKKLLLIHYNKLNKMIHLIRYKHENYKIAYGKYPTNIKHNIN